MLTGRLFKLKAHILGIEDVRGHRQAETIPEGTIVRVVADCSSIGQRMVEVQWMERRLAVFQIDLEERGNLVDSLVRRAAG